MLSNNHAPRKRTSTQARPIQPVATPLDVLWQFPAILRILAVALGLAFMLSLAPGLEGDRFTYFWLAALAASWIALLTLGALFLLRHELALHKPVRIATVALLLLTLNTWIVGGAAIALSNELWPFAAGDWKPVMLRLTGIALTVGLLALAAFRNHWLARQMAVRAKQAELEALQARIRPHFLFNTLNTGAALVHQRPEEAERLLLDLADLFRAALAGPPQIALEEELALARRYLEIEQLRFGERLRIAWQLPDSIPDVMVPTLSIQPLVENAIRHGVERVPTGGRIEIAVTITAREVVVRISNPLVLGDGRPPPSHGVGFSASQARIEALTRGRGRVEAHVQGEHYVATVRLPRS